MPQTLESIHRSNDAVVPQRDVDALFRKLKNGADGNCFFYSLSQSLSSHEGKKGKPGEADVMREQICQLYRRFDRTKRYPDGSLEDRLVTALIGPEMDDASYTQQACEDFEYVQTPEIIAAAMLYKIRIVLFMHLPGQMYKIQIFSSGDVVHQPCHPAGGDTDREGIGRVCHPRRPPSADGAGPQAQGGRKGGIQWEHPASRVGGCDDRQ